MSQQPAGYNPAAGNDPREPVLRDFELFSLGQDEGSARIDELLECFAPDCEFRDCTSPKVYTGRAPLRDYCLEIYAGVPDLRIQNVRLVTEGRTVVSEMDFVGTHGGDFMGVPATGRPLRWRVCCVYDVNENNQIARETYYYDREGIREQMQGGEA